MKRASSERPRAAHGLPWFGADRLNMFVPAIMSVGLLFWVFTVLRDLFAVRSERARAKRARLAGASTAGFVLGTAGSDTVSPGLRLRRSYLVSALVLTAIAVYVVIGSVANYGRPGGYVGDIAWLLAVSLLVAAALAAAAVVSIAVFLGWPDPPVWVNKVLRATPLTRDPDVRPGMGEPSWGLSAAAVLLPLVAAVAAALLGSSRSLVGGVDQAVWEWARTNAVLERADLWSGPWVAVVLVLIATTLGLAGLRCHPFAGAVAGVGGVLAVSTVVLRAVVARPAPGASTWISFPSVPVLVATVVAGVLPVALGVLARRAWLVPNLRAVFSVVAGLVAVAELGRGSTWASDVLVSALVGAAAVVVVDWAVAHRAWHEHCRSCLWSPRGPLLALFSPIHLHVSWRRGVRIAAHASAFAAVVGLTVLAIWVDVPSDPEGTLAGPEAQRYVQLGLVVVASVGALISWRWEAIGAVMLAFAGVGLGIFAAFEYRPEVAVLMTGALLAPAVLLWLSWQQRRSRGAIVALALTTVALLGVTAVGATSLHDRLYGPTHPDSSAVQLSIDEVAWVWSGALTSDGITIVAGVERSDRDVTVELDPVAATVDVPVVRSDANGVARVEITGLSPDTAYSYRVVADRVADSSRGVGSFRTPASGPMSFTVALGSCARNGSNGAVFDAIAAKDPIAYLALGDLHYANPTRDEPAVFRAAYERLLTAPGQAALYRHVPIAYVWDDHDYGPNDADATSPTRAAALATYRQMVPSHASDDVDDPINQAFSVGRVRFVLTDNRSERRDGRMLGETQQRWLVDELATASRSHAVVVWANPSPWVGAPDPGQDTWAGFAEDRRAIAEELTAAGIDNLVMVSGDAHMVALDDGTNTDYSSGDAGGFPLLHAAALDRPGGVKGGPYSGGAFPGGGQFGTLTVEDGGGDVTVRLDGWTWQGERLVGEAFTFPAR